MLQFYVERGSWDTVVDILTRLSPGHFRVRISTGVTDFLSSPNRAHLLWGPASLHFNGYHCTSPG